MFCKLGRKGIWYLSRIPYESRAINAVPSVSFSTFKTSVPKAERQNIKKQSEKNLKKDYLHQKGKSHSSTIWLDRQLRDPFYIRVSFVCISHLSS